MIFRIIVSAYIDKERFATGFDEIQVYYVYAIGIRYLLNNNIKKKEGEKIRVIFYAIINNC